MVGVGNRITCERVPGAVSIKMSNGLTSVVLGVLAMAGARRASTDWERKLVYWIADHDQALVGRGRSGSMSRIWGGRRMTWRRSEASCWG